MRTIEEINADIADAETELEHVQGTATEVYARIVGYYRSVRNWNKGKREEFTERKMFTDANPRIESYVRDYTASASFTAGGTPAYITIYTRKTCPNCPPVLNYCAAIGLPVTTIDADTEDGIREAAAHHVHSCPTAIVYSEAHEELTRCYSVAELKTWVEADTAEAVTA